MDKKYYWIVAVVAGVIIFGCILFFSLRNLFGGVQPASPNRDSVSLPTPTMVSYATPMPSPTQIPVTPGNIWIVTQVGPEAVVENGYKYVIAVFVNQNVPSLSIRRKCGAPGWPAPEVGHQYFMNYGGVLVPIEGVESPLQRFYEFESQ